MGSVCFTNNFTDIFNPSLSHGTFILCKSWQNTEKNSFDYAAKDSELQIRRFPLAYSLFLTKVDDQFKCLQVPESRIRLIDDIISSEIGLMFTMKSKGAAHQGSGQSSNQQFLIESSAIRSRNQPWIVVSRVPLKRYILCEGDVVRIGTQRVRIKEIVKGKSEGPVQDKQQIISKFKLYDKLLKKSEGVAIENGKQGDFICRVCLEEGDFNNPLIAPCACSGSAKYIHLSCVRHWLTQSINPRTIGIATAITWKPLACELCSQRLPFKVYLDGQKYLTVDIPRPEKPYLVLNPQCKQLDNRPGPRSKLYYLVPFKNKKVMSVGRKKECDILLPDDSSVSRHHSNISYVEDLRGGSFILEDNNSKFGTLVLMKKPINLRKQLSGISFQIGRDLIQIHYPLREKSHADPDLEKIDLIDQSVESSEEGEEYEEEVQEDQHPKEIQGKDTDNQSKTGKGVTNLQQIQTSDNLHH